MHGQQPHLPVAGVGVQHPDVVPRQHQALEVVHGLEPADELLRLAPCAAKAAATAMLLHIGCLGQLAELEDIIPALRTLPACRGWVQNG